ncbi:type II toxin-antitoxin system death-on-curing family toxin [Asticcacaulis machinosus]|uniref:Type II toxin-antitoxin system death-on-curing family toxin n=1 Tax=Asticcacaulis machinosus TaxID=2984211 RepID=A0ABT5HLE1_9CAUL|nr:type II toxin-antitoxin system death-on-curing family toxin [Asticcacaulis machinosus]
MSEYRWLREDTLLAIHDEQLAEHGGLAGIRDLKLLQSAVARPQQIRHYGQPDIAELAAAYGYGISRNHPFMDGNKRTAFVSIELFLLLNGFELTADDAACVLTMLSVASGDITEVTFADWIRTHLSPT